MYVGSPPTGAIDSYARTAIMQLQRQVRELQKQVAELVAERDEARDTVGGAV